MAVTALVVSIIAVLISGFSAWFARQQWSAKKLELSRGEHARSGNLTATWTRELNQAMMVTATSSVTTDDDVVHIVNHGPATANVIELMWFSGQSWTSKEWSALAPGESLDYTIRVQSTEDRVRGQIQWNDGREDRHTTDVVRSESAGRKFPM